MQKTDDPSVGVLLFRAESKYIPHTHCRSVRVPGESEAGFPMIVIGG